MKLVVGLGNPEQKYQYTYHNVGHNSVDLVAKKLEKDWEVVNKLEALLIKQPSFVLAKTNVFMNVSGKCVRKLMDFYKISPKDLLVIHDEVDLPKGEVRIQFGRGPAGHNGIKDIILALGTQDFWRLRVGIGRPENPNVDVADYVLSKTTESHMKELANLTLPFVQEYTEEYQKETHVL